MAFAIDDYSRTTHTQLQVICKFWLTMAFLFLVQAYAAQLGAASCSCSTAKGACTRLTNNVIINGGKNHNGQVDLNVNRVQRCREAQADTAFIWFAFAAFIGTFVLSFFAMRRGSGK